jgi:23S rRNA (guanosine2251-2'-O)-methyltransferase
MRSNQPPGRGRDRQDRKGPRNDRGAQSFDKKTKRPGAHGTHKRPEKHKRSEKPLRPGFQAGPKSGPNKVYESPLRARPSSPIRPAPIKTPSIKLAAEKFVAPAPSPTPETEKSSARPSGRGGHFTPTEVWLYGHHAVAAALANQERRVLRLLVTPEAMEKLRADATVPQGVLTRATTVARSDIDKAVGEHAVHQGVAMFTRPIDHHLEDVLAIAEARESCCVVMLDQVSDPHNVGAIIRSAAALDASAVITLDRRAAAETGALAKSASGALDRIAFVQITNLARTIAVLKEHNFWVVGLEADGEKTLSKVDLKGRIAFVLGTEGEGLRRLVRESCDLIARLPITAAAESLNVSNAAAVALYERCRQIDAK